MEYHWEWAARRLSIIFHHKLRVVSERSTWYPMRWPFDHLLWRNSEELVLTFQDYVWWLLAFSIGVTSCVCKPCNLPCLQTFYLLDFVFSFNLRIVFVSIWFHINSGNVSKIWIAGLNISFNYSLLYTYNEHVILSGWTMPSHLPQHFSCEKYN